MSDTISVEVLPLKRKTWKPIVTSSELLNPTDSKFCGTLMEKVFNMFAEVFVRWKWKSIRNCPGRFIFADGTSTLTVEQICNAPTESERFVSATVPDEVIVAAFETGGGLISYVKKDDRFLHTLGNENGFARKLQHLKESIG